MKKLWLVGLVLGLAGCGHVATSEQVPQTGSSNNQTTQTAPANNQGTSGQSNTGSGEFGGNVIAGTNSFLYEFNQADYETAMRSDKLVMLYFYANWCPICSREVSSGLYPAFNELKSDQVMGLRVNFKDNETDKSEEAMAKKYDVPYQHYKVLIKNGRVLKTSPESWSKQRYLDEIGKLL